MTETPEGWHDPYVTPAVTPADSTTSPRFAPPAQASAPPQTSPAPPAMASPAPPPPWEAAPPPWQGSGISNTTAPLAIAQAREFNGMRSGLAFVAFGVIVGLLVGSQDVTAGLLFFAIGAGAGLIGFAISYTRYKRINAAAAQQPGFEHFQTSTKVTYATPLPPAVIAPGETVRGWYGPVFDHTHLVTSYEVLGDERNRDVINTLLFTDKQVIGLMLGPHDVPPSLRDAGTPTFMVDVYQLEAAPESSSDKLGQFRTMYANTWGEIVSALPLAEPAKILGNHLTFGLPYSQIVNVSFQRRMINSGLTLNLWDGREMKYGSFRKEQLDAVEACLRQFVAVKD